MNKPTVRDIAREAGVSLATVDRVLNARPGVRQATITKVNTAIQSLGYVRDLSAANLARQRQYNFAFVLPSGPSKFVDSLRMALAKSLERMAADRVSAKVLPVPAHDPHAIVRTIRQISKDRYQGAAIMAQETPQVRDAIAHLHETGLPVVTMVSDLPNSDRDHFVGINNLAAGRTAARLMGRFLPGNKGKVLVIASSMLARDSIERRIGFDHIIARDFPGVAALPSLEARDDRTRMQLILANAFVANPDIAGIYSLSSGTTALIESMRALNRFQNRVVIAHELTSITREALQAGELDAVIAQDVGHVVRSTLRVLRAKCDEVEIDHAQERIRIDILLRENLV